MAENPRKRLTEIFDRALRSAFGEEFAGIDPMVRPSQNPRFGDFQANVAMSLAKTLGKPPREIAQAIIDAAEMDSIAETPEIAGPGFINIRLKNEYLADAAADLLADPSLGVAAPERVQTVVIDYSSPNAAKEMHVGHLRSTVIGDALARTLDFLGHRVIRQNHLGDWGTQFGMLTEYLIDLGWANEERHGGIDDLNALYRDAKAKFDRDSDFAERARRRVVALQAGDEETLRLWKDLVEESLNHFEVIYRRLGVSLTREDTCAESFYNDALAGVVADLDALGLLRESDGARCVFPPGFRSRDDEVLPLIVQKKDGGFLYATTDLAGIRHRIGTLGADRVIYVVGAPQKQHFEMVFKTAEMAGWVGDASLEHVAFGSVLGNDGRPFKTRSGETVKLTLLLDEAEERAARIIHEKNPTLDEETKKDIARIVGLGAVKYGDLSSDRVKDYIFSWERMLAFEGNTAPYLQNAFVRIRSIFRKGGIDPRAPILGEGADRAALKITNDTERALVLMMLHFAPTIEAVCRSLEPHRLCGYLYDLASAFHHFYEKCPVLKTEDAAVKRSRLALCRNTADLLEKGLDLLGIEVLDRM